MHKAEHVLYAGDSTGAVAALTHADRLRSRLPRATTLLGWAEAGFIAEHPFWHGSNQTDLPTHMRWMFATMNSTTYVHPDCVQHYGSSQGWKCLFGANVSKRVDSGHYATTHNLAAYRAFSRHSYAHRGGRLQSFISLYHRSPHSPGCRSSWRSRSTIRGSKTRYLTWDAARRSIVPTHKHVQPNSAHMPCNMRKSSLQSFATHLHATVPSSPPATHMLQNGALVGGLPVVRP